MKSTMKISALWSLLTLISTSFASPVEPRDAVETLNYTNISPPVYPPDGGCIIVARLYTKDNQLRVYDSGPVCVPDAINFPSVDQSYAIHPLRGVAEEDIKWAAYGWIFPEDKSAATIGRPGCVWVDAKLDTNCVAEHELLPSDMSFPNPFKLAWYSPFWTIDRKANQHIECTSSSNCKPVD